MNPYKARRFWLLWAPTLIAGVGLIAYSATLTPTTNGLTVLGALIAFAGIGAASYDQKEKP